MLTDAADKSPPQLNEAFISLDTISYGKQYALDIYDPLTILQLIILELQEYQLRC